MAKKIIITIDGWSSCGKSTLAKQLAKELGYLYVDSGAMYRAITLYFLRNNIDLAEKKEIKEALKQISLEFIVNPKTQLSESPKKSCSRGDALGTCVAEREVNMNMNVNVGMRRTSTSSLTASTGSVYTRAARVLN